MFTKSDQFLKELLTRVRPLAAQYSINLIGGRDSMCAEYVFADTADSSRTGAQNDSS